MKREEEVMLLLKNKLGISDLTELSHTEEKISKSKALLLFENGLLDAFEVGTFKGLSRFISFFSKISMILQER